jgi:hypothetical protein
MLRTGNSVLRMTGLIATAAALASTAGCQAPAGRAGGVATKASPARTAAVDPGAGAARPQTRTPAGARDADRPGVGAAVGVDREPRPSSDRQAETAIRRRLARTLPRVIWPNIPWRDALDDIAEQTGIQIVPIWSALESEGLGPDRKVRTEAAEITAGEALNLLLDLVGPGDGPNNRADYYINGNVLVITTQARARSR